MRDRETMRVIIRRICDATLFGGILLSFGGAALAAVAPVVTKLDVRDVNNNPVALTVGYEANRLDVDKDGNIYVADPIFGIVNIFNTNRGLVRALEVNKVFAVGVNGSGSVLASGSRYDVPNISILDNRGTALGNLCWERKIQDVEVNGQVGQVYACIPPVIPTDLSVVSDGSVYLADRAKNTVRMFIEGQDTAPYIKDFGPYGGGRFGSEMLNGALVYRTQHRMTAPTGIAVDEKNRRLYISVKEIIDYLNNVSCFYSDSGSQESNYRIDADNSWSAYNDPQNSYYIPTTEDYKYWCPVYAPEGVNYYILIVNLDSGIVEKSIKTGDAASGFRPTGLALDGNGRLYAAMKGGLTAGGGEIVVYDVEAATPYIMTTSGFDSGLYADVEFHQDPAAPAGKGRLFATIEGSKSITVYSIDGGVNPINSQPSSPVLVSPLGSVCINSKTPDLTVENSNDRNLDPLTYGYEVKDSSGNVISRTDIAEGSEGRTSMAVSTALIENGTYMWRAQAYDGYAVVWSNDWATFHVNENNDNPGAPVAVSPVNNALFSPFSSSLLWNSSLDPDAVCGDYIRAYIVEITGEGFSKTFTTTGTSLTIGDVAGLKNGYAYNWRVKAVDSHGVESGWSEGSFTYRTTVAEFKSSQAGTKVYLDGNYAYSGRLLGEAPRIIEGITPGSHFVTFRRAGYEPYHTIINISDPASADYRDAAVYAELAIAEKIRLSISGTALFNVDSGRSTPFVLDYNDDGHKDVIAGGADGKVYLYLSELQADGTTWQLSAKGALKELVRGGDGLDTVADISVSGSNAVPFAVDYNNDGKKDLLVGSGNGQVYLYLNTQNDNDPVFTAAGTLTLMDLDGNDLYKAVTNTSPVVVDYNNDGRKDLVVGSSDGYLRLYVNEGEDSAPQFGVPGKIILDINVDANSKAFFTDWNSDGKKDLVVGGRAGAVHLYLNVGSDETPDFRSIAALQQWILQKRRERGNREYIPYIGYTTDLGDLTSGYGDASPFVVQWDGSSARDAIVGNATGAVNNYVSSGAAN